MGVAPGAPTAGAPLPGDAAGAAAGAGVIALGADVIGAPQEEQNLLPAGTDAPHFGQVSIADAGAGGAADGADIYEPPGGRGPAAGGGGAAVTGTEGEFAAA